MPMSVMGLVGTIEAGVPRLKGLLQLLDHIASEMLGTLLQSVDW